MKINVKCFFLLPIFSVVYRWVVWGTLCLFLFFSA